MSATDLRVRGIVFNAARAAYLGVPEPRTCCGCGAATDTSDGYDVTSAVPGDHGPLWACPPCNYSAASWNEDESVFVAVAA